MRKSPAGDGFCVTRVVLDELQRHGLAGSVLDAGWCEVRLDDLQELTAYVEWAAAIGVNADRDAGEATVLAWAEVHSALAVIDDRNARSVASGAGVEVHGTLWVLAEAVKANKMTEAAVAGLVRAVTATGARYPMSAASDFGRWAREVGLLLPHS